MENPQLVSPSNSSVWSSFFLSKQQCGETGATPYSPELAPADFHLCPRLKSALKRRSFCDATDVIKNATEELKRL